MISRWMAVVLGAAVLAVPGTALAKGDHAKGKGHEKTHKVEKKAKKEKKVSKKAKKPHTYVFKGVYKGDGVVTVTSGSSRVRKGGYVGQDVTFDLTSAKVVAADSDGVAGVTAADVKAGDLVLVQARLPRGTKAPEPTTSEEPTATESTDDPVSGEAPAAITARKLVVLSRSSTEDGEQEAEDAEPAETPAP